MSASVTGRVWRCSVCQASNGAHSFACTSCGYRPPAGTREKLAAQQPSYVSAAATGSGAAPLPTYHSERGSSVDSGAGASLTWGSLNSRGGAGTGPFSPRTASAADATAAASPTAGLHGASASPPPVGSGSPYVSGPRGGSQVPTGSPREVRALVEAQRGQHETLQRALRDVESGKEQVEYLRSVLENSRAYGRDVEAAIEHLAGLLHKKTVECEQLRALASENYAPLRSAVRAQFETSVRQEARQQAEVRHLQAQIESLVQERTQMHNEIASLKALVKELEGAPPHAAYNPADKSLLFNRLAGDLSSSNTGGGAQAANAGDDGPTVSSWNMPGGPSATAVTNAAQRDLLSLLASIDERTSAKLEKAGLFDALKVIAARMCTQVKGMPAGHYPNLAEVVSQVLRERRDVAGGGPHGLQVEAGAPIPGVVRSDRQMVTQLFLAHNPDQYDDLNALLAAHEGREAELYQKLKRQYEQMGGSPGLRLPTEPKTLDPATGAPRGRGSDSSTELHGRIMLMYRKYNPGKIGSRDLNELLSKYPPELLLDSLIEKYGPEPTGDERRRLIQDITSDG